MADGDFRSAGGADLTAFDDFVGATWLGWRHGLQTRADGTQKAVKIPVNAKTGELGSDTDPAAWATRSEALAWLRRQPSGFDGGIGIVLGDYGDGEHLAGLDVDSCFDDDGKLAAWAAPIFEFLKPTYCEFSPSGNGFKAFFCIAVENVRPLLDAVGAKRKSWGKTRLPPGKDHQPNLELYTAKRFFTVTGRGNPTTPIATFDKVALDKLAAVFNTTQPGSGQSTNGSAKSSRRRRRAHRDSPPPGVGGDWYQRCLVGSDGRSLGNLANAALALRSDPAWDGVLAYDEMAANIVLRRPIPSSEPPSQEPFVERPIRDDDMTKVQQWLRLAGLPTVGKEAVADAIGMVARENSFHPIRDYLDGLGWDGVDRLSTWLSCYLGAEQNEYSAAVGQKFLISMVARIRNPGCKADHMLIFEGPQDILKSTACRVLAGDDYFSDAIPENLASKDAMQHMRGKWLIEIAELHSFSKTDATTLKSVLSRQTEIYRPPYGRYEVREARQCLLIGTTNEHAFLRDPTGGRRFWPVAVGRIDIDALWADRDQLFAEAVARFERGEPWWPDRELQQRAFAPEQEARREIDAWEDLIADYLSRLVAGDKAAKIKDPAATDTRVTTQLVAEWALRLEPARLDRSAQLRIAAAIKRLGWKPKRSHGINWWVKDDFDDFGSMGATGATSSSQPQKFDLVEPDGVDTRDHNYTPHMESDAPDAPMHPISGEEEGRAPPNPTPGCVVNQGGVVDGG